MKTSGLACHGAIRNKTIKQTKMEEGSEQKEIRRKIVEIQQDTSLTPQEKGARMQVRRGRCNKCNTVSSYFLGNGETANEWSPHRRKKRKKST